jgi:hypothetical protein
MEPCSKHKEAGLIFFLLETGIACPSMPGHYKNMEYTFPIPMCVMQTYQK